jgi:hypothetical protein
MGDSSRLLGVPVVAFGAGIKDCFIGDGVRGDSLTIRPFSLFGVVKSGVVAPDIACSALRSDSELRRFLRGGPRGAASLIVFNGEFSKLNAPNTVGLSRDAGRFGDKRWTASVELLRDRAANEAVDKLWVCIFS